MKKMTFTDKMRIWFRWFLEPMARFFLKMGLSPNAVTVLGLLGTAIGSFWVARGSFLAGGLVIAATVPFDAIDGTMARLSGQSSDWGAVVDSVSDRYADLLIWAGILYYYLTQGNVLMVMLSYAAAAGTVLVSYVRARGEVQGYSVKMGLMTRVERYLVVIPAIILGYPGAAVIVLALLANWTAGQRFWHIRKQALSSAAKLQQN